MKLLPQSLFGRLLLFLTGGLVLAQLLSAAILLQDRDQALYHAIGGHVAQRIAAIVNLLDTLDDAERRRLVTALDLPPTRLSLDLPWQVETEPDERYHTTLFRALLKRQLGPDRLFQLEINDDLPSPPPSTHRPRWNPSERPDGANRPPPHRRMQAMMLGLRNFVVQIRLRDGATVTFQQILPEEVIAWPVRITADPAGAAGVRGAAGSLGGARADSTAEHSGGCRRCIGVRHPPPAAGRNRTAGSSPRRPGVQHHAAAVDPLHRGSRPHPGRRIPRPQNADYPAAAAYRVIGRFAAAREISG
jgi:hypothetical protein